MFFKHTGTACLETERLLLRRFGFGDVQDMLRNWVANPAIQHNYGEPVYETEESVLTLLNKWIPQYGDDSFYRWVIVRKGSNENIGQIAFCRVYTEEEAAELEYCIGEAFWGNSYAPEALKAVMKYSFEIPQFNKLEAFHTKRNPNSGRVLQKAGMKKVSTVKRFEDEKRQPTGEVCYAITKAEYISEQEHGENSEKFAV